MIDLDKLNTEEKLELLQLLEQQAKTKSENLLAIYKPYPKQREFHNAGADDKVRERLLVAGNQVGKTWSAAFETAMHLTGRYPPDWEGARFADPVTGWAASETSQSTRDTVQRLLLGQVGSWGTGAIPAECIIETKRAAHGVADSIETILVRHVTGGISRVTIKTYDQGRERWQGETLDFVWYDEEPPEDLYIEGLTRTNATNGIVWITFTPLKGMSSVVRRFLVDKSPGTSVTTMTIEDAEHYTPEQRAAIIASYPAHVRDARAKGIPMLGSGLIFAIEESTIVVQPFAIPAYWVQICGIDFGWDHPTGCAKLAWDRDTDTVYVVADHSQSEAVPLVISAAVNPWGEWLPWAWPHDGLQHDKGSGEQLAAQYKKHRMKMLKHKATNPPGAGKEEGSGGNGVEAPLQEMLERMMTGRWKVFSTCQKWLEEYRMYHRKDGVIVKVRDDVICASRYAYMMRRFAKVKDLPQEAPIKDFGVMDPEVGY